MRVLATFAGAFSLGIFLSEYLLPGGFLLPAAWIAFALAAAALLLPASKRRRAILGLTALSLALGYDVLYHRQVVGPMTALSGQEVAVTMTLQEFAQPSDYGARVTVRLPGYWGKAVYYGGEELLSLSPGQTVRDTVLLQDARKIREDTITTFTSKGVFLLAYSRGETAVGPGSAASPRWWALKVGAAMRRCMAGMVSGDPGGFLTGILTGDKSGLSLQASVDLEEAGLTHILAVSGMHCGFLLAMVMMLLGRHRRPLVALCTIPLLIFYALLTGGSPSVLRASMMLTLFLLAPLLRRDSDGPTALAAALMAILLGNPCAIASISLQLSFGAMAGILFLTPRLHRLLEGKTPRPKALQVVEASFCATMGALAFTLPLCAYYFGSLVLVSPLSNLLCLWATSAAFVLGMAALGLCLVCPPLGALVAVMAAVLSRYVLLAAHAMARLPFHALSFAAPDLKYALLFVYGLFAAAALCPGRRRKYAVAAGLCALCLFWANALGSLRWGGTLTAQVLNVGQGQSVLLSSHGAYALVDCGSANSYQDPGATAADHLQSLGCRRLDYLILTHYDADHINGMEMLLSRMEVERLLLPRETEEAAKREEAISLARSFGVTVEAVDTPRSLSLGEASLSIFPPVGGTSDNELCLSVLADAGENQLLITGDLDSAGEAALLRSYDLPEVEVLVAGHHGSRTSTSQALLDALQPQVVCISVGSNSYGHPTEEMLRRVGLAGCAVYRTDLQGTITLSLN